MSQAPPRISRRRSNTPPRPRSLLLNRTPERRQGSTADANGASSVPALAFINRTPPPALGPRSKPPARDDSSSITTAVAAPSGFRLPPFLPQDQEEWLQGGRTRHTELHRQLSRAARVGKGKLPPPLAANSRQANSTLAPEIRGFQHVDRRDADGKGSARSTPPEPLGCPPIQPEAQPETQPEQQIDADAIKAGIVKLLHNPLLEDAIASCSKSHMSDVVASKIYMLLVERQARAEQTIIETGAEATEVYFLKEGGLEVIVDRTVKGVIVETGRMFGETCFLPEKSRRTADIRAAVPSIYLSVTAKEVLDVIDDEIRNFRRLISAEEEEQMRHFFDRLDPDGSGTLNQFEVGTLVAEMNSNFEQADIDFAFRKQQLLVLASAPAWYASHVC